MPSLFCEPVLYGDISLHGSYFAPVGEVKQAVLLISPLFEEKRCAHRALNLCARALADAGAGVFHPDLYGTGNSHGDLSEIGLDRWLDDLHAAVDFLRSRTDGVPLTVLACRAGALLIADAIVAGLSADRFILWNPVTNGRGYLNQLRTRRMIQDKMTGETPPEIGQYEVEGQLLSPALYTDFQALRLPAEMPSIPLTLLQCSFNEKLLNEYERFIAQWEASRVQIRTLVCEPFWHPHSPSNYTELAQAVTNEVMH
ncbi:MAG TPA: alpha/beta hydrolase [Armatimonadota bacterium]|nr:alpha/beta hydrolase [Armatimonadota bacterium]